MIFQFYKPCLYNNNDLVNKAIMDSSIYANPFLPIPELSGNIQVTDATLFYSRYPNDDKKYQASVYNEFSKNVEEGERRNVFLENFLAKIQNRFRTEILCPWEVLLEDDVLMLDTWRGDITLSLKHEKKTNQDHLFVAIPTTSLKGPGDSAASAHGTSSLESFVRKGPFIEAFPFLKENKLYISANYEDDLFKDAPVNVLDDVHYRAFSVGSFPFFFSTDFEKLQKRVKGQFVYFSNENHSILEWTVFQIIVQNDMFVLNPEVERIGFKPEDIIQIKGLTANSLQVQPPETDNKHGSDVN